MDAVKKEGVVRNGKEEIRARDNLETDLKKRGD